MPLAQPDVVTRSPSSATTARSSVSIRASTLHSTSGLLKVEAESVSMLKFSYFNDGDNTVWDVGGLYLGDPERANNGIDILRRCCPPCPFPEGLADQCYKIENAEHPYTGLAYFTDGGTRIESIQDSRTSPLNTARSPMTAVVAEGTQDQATMKRALDAAQHGLTVISSANVVGATGAAGSSRASSPPTRPASGWLRPRTAPSCWGCVLRLRQGSLCAAPRRQDGSDGDVCRRRI